MKDWYVLYTKPHAEFQLSSALASRGVQVFLPSLPVDKPRPGRPTRRALFPSYVFARFDAELKDLPNLKYIPGLHHIVQSDGSPAMLGSEAIDYIRAQLRAKISLDQRGRILRHGDPVEILEEPFRGIRAIFDCRLTPDGRIRVLLQCLSPSEHFYQTREQHIPLELDITQIQKKDVKSIRSMFSG